MEYGDKKKFKIQIRRNLEADVRPEAELVDGKTFSFTLGWNIGEDDNPLYLGEQALIPDREGYPIEAPGWIASGDLVAV